MYTRSAPYYDLLYEFKDFARETRQIAALIQLENPDAQSILDVACGTAEHLKHLAASYRVAGLDLEPQFVDIARLKIPNGQFWPANMADFDLATRFDVVLSLFSSIGYLVQPAQVISALSCFRRHLNPNGVVIVEPWFSPDKWQTGVQQMLTVEQPDLKVCRMSNSSREKTLSRVNFHYLVSRPDGVEYFEERHELALYTHEEMMGFFEQAGLVARHDSQGIFGRGLYIARQRT